VRRGRDGRRCGPDRPRREGLVSSSGRGGSLERYRCPRAALVHYEISSARRRGTLDHRAARIRNPAAGGSIAARGRVADGVRHLRINTQRPAHSPGCDRRQRRATTVASREWRSRAVSSRVGRRARRSTSHPTALKSLVSPSPRASPAVQLSRSTRAASWACYYLVRRPPPGRHDRFEGFPFGGHGVSPGRQRRQAPTRLIARRCPRARAPDARR
jgi:hypothetical protein